MAAKDTVLCRESTAHHLSTTRGGVVLVVHSASRMESLTKFITSMGLLYG